MLELLRQLTSSNVMLHNCLLVMVIIRFILPALVLALTANPIVGDLTRMSYLSEEQFGWHKPQIRYETPTFRGFFQEKNTTLLYSGTHFHSTKNEVG